MTIPFRGWRGQGRAGNNADGLTTKPFLDSAAPETRITSSLIALEQRLVFDAAAVATGADGMADAQAQKQAEAAVESGDPGEAQGGEQPEDAGKLSEAAAAIETAGTDRNEFVFIDGGITDLDQLLAQLPADSEAVVLDPNRDGVEQIADVLSNRDNIDALHIVSHGDPGSLRIGTGALTLGSMSGDYADELANIANALSGSADILIYGCNFAEGAEGLAAAGKLAELTGADVAASDDPTGHALRGGDWDLEVNNGAVEVASISAAGYEGLLGSAPSVSISATAPLMVAEDATLTISEMSLSEVDGESVSVSLSAASGVLTLKQQTGLANVNGDGTALVTFEGLVTDINAAINGMTYQPLSDFNGSDAVTISASDGDGTGNGVLAVDVTPDNDNPSLSPAMLVVQEGDSGVAFSPAEFGLSDPDIDPVLNVVSPQQEAQMIIQIQSLPTKGTLRFAGNRVSVGSVFSYDQVALLSYTHDGSDVVSGDTDGFSVTVNDGAGGQSGVETITVSLTPKNLPPTISAATSVYEGQDLSVGLSVSDQESGHADTAANSTVRIVDVSGVTEGMLYFDADGDGRFDGGEEVVPNFTFAADEAGKLRYEHAGGEPDMANPPSFVVNVTDAGGGEGTGAALTSPDTTITLSISPVDDDPTLDTNVALNVAPGATVGISGAHLDVNDVDSADKSLAYTMESRPAFGVIQVDIGGGDWKTLGIGGRFTQAMLDTGRIRYVQQVAVIGPTVDSFDFTVRDSALKAWPNAGEEGAVRDSAGDIEVNSFTLNLTGPNPTGSVFPSDPSPGYGGTSGSAATNAPVPIPFPTMTNDNFSGGAPGLVEGGDGIITSSSPPMLKHVITRGGIDAPADETFYTLTSLPSNGSIQLWNGTDWVDVGLFGSFTQADIDAGNIRFLHGGGEDFFSSFDYSVSDGGPNRHTSTFSLRTAPGNDAPTANDGSVFMAEGDTHTVTTTEMQMGDPDNVNSDDESGYGANFPLQFRVTSLPVNGTLFNDADGDGQIDPGEAIDTTTWYDESDLTTGRLKYRHDGSDNTTAPQSSFLDGFTYRTRDHWAALGDPEGLESTDAAVSIELAAINDPPSVPADKDAPEGTVIVDGTTYYSKNDRLVAEEGSAGNVIGGNTLTTSVNDDDTGASLAAIDPDNTTVQRQYKITSAVAHGTLKRNGSALGVGSVFTQKDIDDGLLTYDHNGAEVVNDAFRFVVSDGVNTTAEAQFDILINPRNDAPSVTVPVGPLFHDSATNLAFTGADIVSVEDIDLASMGLGETDFVSVTVSVDAGNVVLDTTGVNVTSGASGTNTVTIQGTRNAVNGALISLEFSDGGTDLDNESVVLTISADDRLRDGSGNLIGGANGGATNDDDSVVDAANNVITQSVTIRSSRTNDDPVVSTSTAVFTFDEDSSNNPVTGISVSDADDFGQPITVVVEVPVNAGTLAASASGTATVTPSNGGRTLALFGTESDINATLTTLSYTPVPDFNTGAVIALSITVNDNGNTGTGGSGAISGSVNINVTPVNDRPTVDATGDAGDNTVTLNTGTSVAFDAANKGVISVDDAIDIGTGEVNDIQVSLTVGSGTLTLSGTAGLTFDGGANGTATMTIRGGRDQINAALDGLVYTPFDPNVDNTDNLAITVNDRGSGMATYPGDPLNSGALSATRNIAINVSGINDGMPDTTLGAAPLSSAFEDTWSNIGKGSWISDPDDFGASMDVTVSVTAGKLRFGDLNGATVQLGANDGSTGSITIRGTETQLNDALATLQYLNDTADNNGASKDTLSVVVDDLGNTGSGGSVVVSQSAPIHITPVNDAPTAGGTATVSVVSEDTSFSAGTLVSDLMGAGQYSDARDTVPGGSTETALAGLGVVGNAATPMQGAWEYSVDGGITWAAVPTGGLSAASSLVLPDTARLRFVPALDFNATPGSLTVHLSDGTGFSASSSSADLKNISSATGGSGGWSIGTVSVGTSIAAVNDAPLASMGASLSAVDEDTLNPPGETVSTLFSGNFNDAKDTVTAAVTGGSTAGDLAGVAIVGNAADALSEGLWQYFDGATWVDVGVRSEDTALAVSAAHGLRFLPTADFNGIPGGLTVRLIDDSSGVVSTGVTDDLTAVGSVGGTTAYSADPIPLSTAINPVNDAPAIDALDAVPNVTENGPPVVLDADATLSDLELDGIDNWAGAVLTLVRNGGADPDDVFAFSPGAGLSLVGSQIQKNGKAIAVWDTATVAGQLTVTFTDANGEIATAADADALLRGITYANGDEELAGLSVVGVTLDYTISDGNLSVQGSGGALNGTGSISALVTGVNDPPIVDLNGADGTSADFATVFTEGAGPVAIADTDVLVSDVDDTTLTTVVVTPGGVLDGSDEVLIFEDGSGAPPAVDLSQPLAGPVSVTVGSTTFDVAYDGILLTITNDAGGEMAVGDVQALLAAVRYENGSSLPTVGDRTFSVLVNDGDTDSNLGTSTVNVVRSPETASWSLTGATTIDEGGVASYFLGLSNPLRSGETATIDLNLTDGSAISADHADFVAAVNAAVGPYAGPGSVSFDGTTVTFASDGTGVMALLQIDVAVTNDVFVEGPETYNVAISNPASTTGETILVDAGNAFVVTTIDDTQGAAGPLDGPAQWAMTGPTSADEGETPQYTVSLSGAFGAGEVVTVDLALADISTNSSDYADAVAAITAAAAVNPDVTFNAATGTLTYTAPSDGASMTDLVIDLPITDDAFVEGTESYSLDLSNATTSTDANVAVNAAAASVTTIVDDIQGPSGPADGPAEWSIAGPTSADEGETPQYTVSLSGAFGAGEVVTVDLALSDISTNSSDYADLVAAITAAAVANPDVTFNAATGTLTYTAPSDGVSMTDLVIDLPISDDALVEGAESYSLDLSNATTSTGANVAVDATAASVTTTIDDTQGPAGPLDGPAEWSITGPTSADEGETPQYTVSLSGAFGAGEVVTVDLALADISTNSSDYVDVVAAITATAAANPNITFNAATGTLTYTSPSDGASMADLVIDLPITDDILVEGPESFSLDLSNATTSTAANVAVDAAAASVTTTIDDTQGLAGPLDGPAEWSIAGPTSADEGDTPQYTVSLGGSYQAGEVVTVDLGLTDIDTDSSDYADIVAAITAAAAANPDVTFNAATDTLTYTAPSDGALMADLVIDLPLTDDGLIEGPEAFSLDLSNPTSSTGVSPSISATAASVTTTIDDTQGPAGPADGPAEWSITGPAMTNEGDTAQYTVALAGTYGIGEVVTIDIGLTDVNSDSADYADFVAAVSAAAAANPDVTFNAVTGTLTYTSSGEGAAMTLLTIDLAITADGMTEAPESLDVALSTPTSSTGVTPSVDAAAFSVNTIINGPPVAELDINSTLVNTAVSGNVLTNDFDPDGDPLTVTTTPVTAPANGFLTLNADGTYTYTPDPDFVGTDSFEYEVCDSQGNCETETVVIEVRDSEIEPGNTAPIANDDTASGFVDTVINGAVLSNDGDPDGDFISLNTTPVSAPTNGAVTLNADGTFAYTPNTGFTGTDTFVYEITDPAGNVDTATVTITVEADGNGPANDVPAAGDDAGIGQKNDPISGELLLNDSDPNGDVFTINTTPLVGPANGTVVINTDGSYTYTPNDDFVGTDSFVYEVCDTGAACDQATVVLTVFDNPPVAADDINSTVVDTPVRGSVLVNDSDPNTSDDLTVNPVPVTAPTNGSLILSADGIYIYTPDAGFTGTDSFEYEVCDEGGNCTTATVTIEVRDTAEPVSPGNTPPIANDDTGSGFVDTVINGDLLSNDGDPDGDVITVNTTPTVVPANGAVTINADGTYSYTPNTGFTGTDTFIYAITDPAGNVDTATVTITIAVDANGPANDAPVAGEDAGITRVNSPVGGNVLANDSDPNGDPLTLIDAGGTPVTGPTPITTANGGTVVIDTDGAYTYTPADGFSGADSFAYTVSDALGGSDTATVSLTVFDSPPEVEDDINVTSINTPVNGNVLTNDNGGDPNQGVVVADPATGNPIAAGTTVTIPTANGGTLEIAADGSYTYIPAADFVGEDTVIVSVCDEGGNCLDEVLTVEVRDRGLDPDNRPPIASDDSFEVFTDGTLSSSLVGNDADPDGDVIVIVDPVTGVAATAPITVATAAGGMVTLNPDGSFDYTPAAGYIGADSFDYSVIDPSGASDNATASINVQPDGDPGANDAPDANDDMALTGLDTPVSGNLLINDSDVNGDALTLVDAAGNTVTGPTTFTTAAGGSVTVDTDGSYTYTPAPGFLGTDSFTYTVDDGLGGTDTAAAYIATVNDSPIPVNDTFTVLEDGSVVVPVLDNDSDVDGDALSVTEIDGQAVTAGDTVTLSDGSGEATLNAEGTVTFSPTPNYNGPATFTYAISDGVTVPVTATVVGTVTPVNDAPAGTPIADQTNLDSDQGVTLEVSGSFSDIDDDTLSYSATGLPPGLSIDPVTGVISGDLQADASVAGPYSVTVTADDGNGGIASTGFVWTVNNVAPEAMVPGIPPTESDRGRPVTPIDTAAAFDDPDGDVLTYNAADLPPGLSIDPETGMITGTIDPSVPPETMFLITLTADDGEGGLASQEFSLTVMDSVTPAVIEITPSPHFPGARLPILDTGRPAIAAFPVVLDTVNSVGYLNGAAGAIGQEGGDGAVSDVVDWAYPLGSVTWVDSRSHPMEVRDRGIVGNAVWAIEHRPEWPRRFDQAFGRDSGLWQPEGLTGFSLRFALGDSDIGVADGDRNEIVIETLVRDRILYIEAKERFTPESMTRIVEFSATLADGRALPNWIHVDPQGLILVDRPVDLETLELTVFAILDDGTSIARSVTIEANSGEIQPLTADPGSKQSALFSDQVHAVAYAFDRNVEALNDALRSLELDGHIRSST